MGYRAIALGTTELMSGLDYFIEQSRAADLLYLSASVHSTGPSPWSPFHLFHLTDDLRIAVIGLLETPKGPASTPQFELATRSMRFEDPKRALERLIPELVSRADLLIVMGRLTPATIRELVGQFPEIDVVISTEFAVALQTDASADNEGKDREGFLGPSLILYTDQSSYGVSSARLSVDAGGAIVTARLSDHRLDENIPDDPRVRLRLEDFYDGVASTAAVTGAARSIFSNDPVRLDGQYVGASRCAACHETETSQWLTTAHASAFKTLLDRHRHFHPKCVPCHVVAYGARQGYQIGTSHSSLEGVQCEACHGPGGEHAQNPAAANIRRSVPEVLCLECHTVEHSDAFSYSERLPRVLHSPQAE